MTSRSRMTPRAGSWRMSDQTWKPPESLSTGPLQSMNRWIPPPAWMRRAPGRRSRWKALTTTASIPTARRSSLVTPRTPARVASGRKLGTARLPRRVASGSAIRGAKRGQAQHEDELVRDRCLRHPDHLRLDFAHQGLQPMAIDAVHPLDPAAERASREADHGVASPEAAQQPGRGAGVLPIEDRDELEEEGDVGCRERRAGGGSEVARLDGMR